PDANPFGEPPGLEPPRRRARLHVQRAVPTDPSGPRIACDLGADGDRPGLDDACKPCRRTVPSELACDVVSDAFHHVACTNPLATASTCAGSAGSAAAVVDVISVWLVAATLCASARRRSGSSSESTSSRRSSGA